MAFRKDNKTKTGFSKISIGLASPEEILEKSSGEVLKPETINYRTYKPERDGLFCEKIFGPVKDYECHCGKYKRIRYKGIVCDRCGVMVTEKKVRRERMGHIKLVVPVAHIWYFRSLPNKIGYLLGLPSKKLDAVIYYERYVVIQPGAAEGVDKLDLLTEEEYFDIIDRLPEGNDRLEDTDPNKFIAKMGAEAVYDLLTRIDLDSLSYELRHRANTDGSQQRKTEALKRLQIVESFRASRHRNKPEWMILQAVPVIPPELRPLVPLDGGRFATSDLNDLYRRVIIRNNRLKRLIEIKAPEVILRNEKRMLQEAVDSLLDNSRKSSAVKTDANRPLKSLSDSLKGKQGRFRQNLLGKRVDYSARSVIVVGPELKMHECGLPKNMAAELYKPFVIRKLIERGIVKTVKSAKKIVDRKEPVVWDILEHVMKGHPVLLNRAPTLHRLGIQAFQPKMIEGKAIQLHPLACTAFNADFDGDQMAVHLPLGNEAVLEAQMLMLGAHNILNPANGAPITVPSQDMVLGLYYITKLRPGAQGEGHKFYGPEEALIAYNEGRISLHAPISVVVDDIDEQGNPIQHLVDNTSVGRVIFNQSVPKEIGYVNKIISKKSLRDIIGDVISTCGVTRSAQFLDDIKNLGYYMAFRGGLSFNLGDVLIPPEKEQLVAEGNEQVQEVLNNYAMGFITNNERYNQIIDIWTHVNSRLTDILMKQMTAANQGFNSVFMMLDSGARGSKDQIRQLAGMRGLMAKPQKAGAEGGQIIENPILANFKEGLSVLEYFISTHGARKGLADTALKTADAGYLTRRLVDVAHDVIIHEEDCGTLRGLVCKEIKNNEEVVASLGERILGRVSVHDVFDPISGELIVASGDEIDDIAAKRINESPIESVEIRSVLTCESKKGVCAKCYGRDLSKNRLVQKGEAVGVIAAQSIGEPGTQLTLRTFHVGGVASNIAAISTITSRYEGVLEIDELRTVQTEEKDANGRPVEVVIGRLAEMRIVDPNTKMMLTSANIPYGSKLYFDNGATLKKGDVICEWDPFNAVIISEVGGKIHFENLIENVTYRVDYDEQTNLEDRIIIESKDRTRVPEAQILDKNGQILKTYALPVGAHVMELKEGDDIKVGDVLVKIPRSAGNAGDITGGLPRVTELFEARNPSNPAIVSEIDGEVKFGKLKRGNREISVTSKLGETKKYLVPLSKQILVQENDYVRAGTPLSDGATTPADILNIMGPTAVQEYIVNEVQDVYRMQGVKINDKHFEVIVRQMMRKVNILDPGDTCFLEQQIVDKREFMEENDRIWGKKVVVDAGDSDSVQPGQIITARKLRDENSALKRRDLKIITVRDAVPATSEQILQGITRAALQTSSFMSAASFQETTKVLNEAAINGKTDTLEGMKENVICGHLIPAGTGLREYNSLIVAGKDDIEAVIEKPEIINVEAVETKAL
ncbi:DNA-directed RNA polymerase subunit beta' [Muribaculum intestinale]|mgnify:FL=1|jgi:DNA-directed RNA polymerase subunit beta'|uniref:DNA-directed RNA polymerase subunit beta' n=6 Tax=Muribaculum intestinale TaxID=1796646 RepID=A0A1B1SBE0_9BACT|nr:DNA-directed RNA polymerase subunit beta' [Muribaculum intestinale]ROS79604.1 DNA-directed RNA polymerase subunit beta' [Muribaculaceae bacterium Isolate-042 (Harlan)]ROT11357.1 DNA-directed RNA polymerase subunit beta' [Muribaculaceae bacterium Isolate-100 (HZI)]RXE67370.1 DNA-directed RNA polymerase subunit beta' [Muribaculaceae bacterium Isolate-007 (NCI)]ANU64096.1 DNA-directed RNA polymerase subunit beta' [Muribaculum intestinale]ASB37809.1 DNA-directed RNA polymerase subunit beta' [Mu